MGSIRSCYLPHARGRVLEIGLGSGHNLSHYTNEVTYIDAVDPLKELTALAKKKITLSMPPVEIHTTSAEVLPFESETFDSVVSSWTLCSIPDVKQSLDEIWRVLKPSGYFIFMEHGASPDSNIAAWQRRIEPAWKCMAGGCHLTRDITSLLTESEFTFDTLEASYLSGPRWASFTYRGVARKIHAHHLAV